MTTMTPLQVFRRQQLASLLPIANNSARFLSTITSPANSTQNASSNPKAAVTTTTTTEKPHTIDPRWLTTMKRRIGKCMMFGLKPGQIQEAGKILQQLARDWRELVAGSEGYLTNDKRRSLFRYNVAWGEMDVMIWYYSKSGHVNNVTYVRYAETARVNWTRNLAIHIDPAHKTEWMNLVNSTGIGLILRSIKIDYKFPMKWPDKITVYQKLVHDPSTSSLSSNSAFEFHVMILSEAHQRPAARCHEDIVTYDYKLERKTSALPPFMMEQFKIMWELQEEAKRVWQQRILEIENSVRALEVESWDREDAVEDVGFAAGK